MNRGPATFTFDDDEPLLSLLRGVFYSPPGGREAFRQTTDDASLIPS